MNILRICADYALIQVVSKLLVHTHFYLPAAKTLLGLTFTDLVHLSHIHRF